MADYDLVDKVSILKTGDRFKNYTEFCKHIGIPVATGYTRIRQLKELANYVDLVKDPKGSFGLTIQEVHDMPKGSPKMYAKGYKWVNQAVHERIVYEILKRKATGMEADIFISRSRVISLIYLVKDEFFANRAESHDLLNTSSEVTATSFFYDVSTDLIKTALRTCMRSLPSAYNLAMLKTYRIQYTDDNSYSYATSNGQLQHIKDMWRHMGCFNPRISDYISYKEAANNVLEHFIVTYNQDHPNLPNERVFKVHQPGYLFTPKDQTVLYLTDKLRKDACTFMPARMRQELGKKIDLHLPTLNLPEEEELNYLETFNKLIETNIYETEAHYLIEDKA